MWKGQIKKSQVQKKGKMRCQIFQRDKPGVDEPKKDQECQEKETIPAGRKTLKIPELFKSQERKIMETDMLRLEKEEILEMKRRMETSWKCKKTQYDHLRWARELLTGQVMDLVLMEGKEPGMTPETHDENMSPGARGGEACPYHWQNIQSNIPGGEGNTSRGQEI